MPPIARRYPVVAALVVAVAIPPTAARAADPSPGDWPQFHRDARRSGDNPEARLEFPLQRVTAVRFPAPVYASPAVVGGKVYVQDALGNVACIDPATNRAAWTTHVGGVNNTSSPAVAGGKVYVGSSAGALVVLDAATGKLVRRVPADAAVLAAPAVAGDAVYFSTLAGTLVKTDPAGEVQWTFSGGKLSTTEFAVLDRDILFFAGSTNTTLYRLRDEGKQVRVLAKTPAASNCCPVGGPAFVTPETYAFQSFDSEFGRFYWVTDDGKGPLANDVSDSRVVPAVRGGVVYRGDKCFTRDPGLKTAWRADPAHLYDGGFHSSPALGKDVLAVGCEQGLIHFLPLDGTGKVRKPVWQFKTSRAGEPNSAVSSSPAVVDGRVYFGGEDGILYGLGKGAEVPVADLPGGKGREPTPILKGSEWPTPGGDMGFSYVSPDREVRPPFDVAWRTRVWGVFKAPMIVAAGKVFCTGRLGSLAALDAATGEILWKVHHPGVESRPAPTYVDGKLLMMRVQNGQGDSPYVSGASGGPPGEGLYCHDAATGKVLWHRPMKFKYHFNHDGLAADGGKVFVEEFGKDGAVQAAAYAIDTGKEVWRQPLDAVVPQPKKALKLPPRFCGVMAGGLWCASVSDAGTVALDPATGRVVWSNKELFITRRTRVAARDGVLVVFTEAGDHALDAKTGEHLWKGAATSTHYTQALSDRYLRSKGQQGVYPPATCAWPVYANGHWYSHQSYSTAHGSNAVAVMREPEAGEVGLLGQKLVVWSRTFLSNACPTPTPAYGRLYYSPSAEGVVYCFAPTAAKPK